MLKRLRANPGDLPVLLSTYRTDPAAFITHWGNTSDPRNVQRGLPALIPFILFPKQIELVDWLIDRWRAREPGLIEKSRDAGLSWLTIGLACTMCLLYRDASSARGPIHSRTSCQSISHIPGLAP
jgi:phage terminase large subunit